MKPVQSKSRGHFQQPWKLTLTRSAVILKAPKSLFVTSSQYSLTARGRFTEDSLEMILSVSVRNMQVISVSSFVILCGDCCKVCKECFMADEICLASSSVLKAGRTPDRKSVNTAGRFEWCASMFMCIAKWSPARDTKWRRWSGSRCHFFIQLQNP